MDYIEIKFVDGTDIEMKGKISIQGSCVLIKVDDDKDPTTPPLNIIYPMHVIKEVQYRNLSK